MWGKIHTRELWINFKMFSHIKSRYLSLIFANEHLFYLKMIKKVNLLRKVSLQHALKNRPLFKLFFH